MNLVNILPSQTSPLHLIECQIGDSKIRAEGRENRRGKFCMRTRFPLLCSRQAEREGRPLHKQVEKELLSGGGGQIRALLCLSLWQRYLGTNLVACH